MRRTTSLYCLLSVVSSNFLTAVVVYYFTTDCSSFQDQNPPRHVQFPFSSSSAHAQDSINHPQDIFSYFNQSPHSDLVSLIDKTSPMNVIKTSCALPSNSGGCLQFEALLNIQDKTVCRCKDTKLSVGNKCNSNVENRGNVPSALPSEKVEADTRKGAGSHSDVTLFAVTPTYTRHTQKVDLTSLCYTLEKVANVIWIVVEDSVSKTPLVTNLLNRCKVESVHLNAKTSAVYKVLKSRGVEQRNTGLSWIRDHCKTRDKPACKRGVLYFMDDDNKYDIRIFDEMKKTKVVSVFPVAFSGGLKYEGPICDNGKVSKWRAHYAPERTFPMDMAGFVINISHFLDKPEVKMGFTTAKGRRVPVKDGHLETDYLENFATRNTVECRGSSSEVLVWHVKTLKPTLVYESKHTKDKKLEA